RIQPRIEHRYRNRRRSRRLAEQAWPASGVEDLLRSPSLLDSLLHDLICRQRSERVLAIKVSRRIVGVPAHSQPRAKVDGVLPPRRLHVILQFIVVLVIVGRALVAAAPRE